MSIIQSIRDKAAWIIIAAIALALIAFIAQDAFHNGSVFNRTDNTLGVVNGKDIDAVEFDQKYRRAEQMYAERGFPANEMMRGNIREAIWSEYVDEAIMEERYEALGIEVSDKELSDMLYGANPPQDLRQQFTDPNTGRYDANAAYQQIQALRKQKNTPAYASFFGQYLPALAKGRQKEKYLGLLAASVYVPKWLVQKTNADNALRSSVSYVNVPYSSISDSAVKVSDEQIEEYVSKHKDDYKQEASRSIQYVVFDAGPTREDSAGILSQMQALKNEFTTTTDIPAFFVRNGSETPYTDAFQLKSQIRSEFADSITALNEGQVAGPFIEGGNYVLVRVLAKRTMPDSVKVRHILVKTADKGKPTLADSIARKKIDSVANAISGGADFNLMVARYSDDEGSKTTGGEYEFSASQFSGISKEFAEVAFYGVAGDKKVVKVDNPSYAGYHYIEVLNQKGFEPAFKIAQFSKAIVPSNETTSRQNGLASQFAAESRDKKAFDEAVRKNKYTRLTASEIKPLDAVITGIGSSREMVKWIFDAEVGNVAETPFQIEDKFVVPVVTRVFKEGTMTAENARATVESILRNQIKAQQIKAKLKNAATLEAAAQAGGQQVVRQDSVMFNSAFIPNLGQEAKVIGASFNKAYQNKPSPAIEGNGGVFVVKVNNISAEAMPTAEFAQQQDELEQRQQRAFSDPRLLTEMLKKTVKIKDNRHKFF